MLEMNLGLQWGMNEFRYGSQKSALARRLAALNADKVRQAARKHLAGGQCTMVSIRPAGAEK
jgi:predicted Zn-dependent peptidase